MKSVRRYFPLLLVVLALTAAGCSEVLKKPVLHSYAISGLQDIGLEDGVITANISVTLDLENPAKTSYSARELKVALYKQNGTLFGNACLLQPVTIPGKTRQEVMLPLKLEIKAVSLVTLLNKASSGFDFESMIADIEGTISAGAINKKIKIEKQPVKELFENLKK